MTKLEWGQTPWDQMTRAELQLQVQRLYSATVALNNALQTVSQMSGRDPYFSDPKAAGTAALEKGRQAITAAEGNFESGNVFEAFFRYADDLLFEAPIGHGWMLDETGRMVALSREHSIIYHNAAANTAGLPHLHGYVRRLTWADLEPKA